MPLWVVLKATHQVHFYIPSLEQNKNRVKSQVHLMVCAWKRSWLSQQTLSPGDVEKVTPNALLKQKSIFFFFSPGHLKKKSVQGNETKEVNFNSRCWIMYERKLRTYTHSHHTCTYTYTQVHTCLHLFFGVLGACSWHKARCACHNQSEHSAEALAFTTDLSGLAGLWGFANNKPPSVGDGSPVTQLATRGETWPATWYEIRVEQTKEERKEVRKEGRKWGCSKESFASCYAPPSIL